MSVRLECPLFGCPRSSGSPLASHPPTFPWGHSQSQFDVEAQRDVEEESVFIIARPKANSQKFGSSDLYTAQEMKGKTLAFLAPNL